MTAIVFETPGLIDIRAFTVMGMSAKIGDHPIGKFGTGLKYAIAVLVRMGAEPVVWIGKDQYVFFSEKADFRGKEFQLVRMRAKKWPQRLWREYDLPFTTEYGKYWKPWQVYRELEANTRDESGSTFEIQPSANEVTNKLGSNDKTWIIVDHPDFLAAYEKSDEVFLPGAATKIDETVGLQVFPGTTKFLYWRGMKVYELQRESMFTYNILSDVELTEDRTLKYEFYAKMALGDFVQKSDDPVFIKKIVTAPEDTWEHTVDFSSWKRPTPSAVFREVVRDKPRGLLSSARDRFMEVEPPPHQVMTESVTVAHPTPWAWKGEYIEDANGHDIFRRPSGYHGYWPAVAQKVVDLMNQHAEIPEAQEPEERPAEEEAHGT